MSLRLRTLLTALAIQAFATNLPAAELFDVKDLGIWNFISFPSAAINDAGTVVVGTNLISPTGTVQNIGGESPSAINNAGSVVGTFFGAGGATVSAYLFDGSSITTMAVPAYSSASGINNLGQIVGYAGTDASHYSAFILNESGYHDLGLGNHSSASGINDSGIISGTIADDSVTNARAFRYDHGNITYLLPLGMTLSYGGAISNTGRSLVTGVKLGTAGVPGMERGYIYDGATLTALPLVLANHRATTGSNAADINDSGHVVGATHGAQVAFYYDGANMYDLNTLVPGNLMWNLHFSFAINNSDQILALGQGVTNGHAAGPTHILLVQPVPLPASTWFLAIALGALGLYSRASHGARASLRRIRTVA